MIIQEAHDLFQNITGILRNLITHTYIFVILTKNDENLPGIKYLLLRFKTILLVGEENGPRLFKSTDFIFHLSLAITLCHSEFNHLSIGVV